MDKKTLWLRLKTYEFDHLVPPSLWQRVVEAFAGADAATKAFADKLARKLGWSTPFAFRAVAEYRKFVYLGMVSDFPVTPSKVIDQKEFNEDPPPDIWLVPKFQESMIAAKVRRPEPTASTNGASLYGDAPLYSYFESDPGAPDGGFDAFDGGQSGGAGGGASWSDSSGTDPSNSDAAPSRAADPAVRRDAAVAVAAAVAEINARLVSWRVPEPRAPCPGVLTYHFSLI